MTALRLRRAAGKLGRRERRRREMRERIFRAALRLFAERGFVSTTVEDITEAADVGKGTFFNYFPSKEHVLAGFAETQLSKLQMLSDPAIGQGQPLKLMLRRLIQGLAEEPGRSPALVRGMLIANLSSEPVRRLMRQNLARGRRILAQFLATRQCLGEIRADLDAMEIAWGFQQLFFGALILWALHPTSSLSNRLAATFPLFWSGFLTDRAKSKSHRGGVE
jgi:AcrR family transcriptional regulator